MIAPADLDVRDVVGAGGGVRGAADGLRRAARGPAGREMHIYLFHYTNKNIIYSSPLNVLMSLNCSRI